MKFNYIAPEVTYTCPMTGEKFYSYKEYCKNNPPCLYFNSVIQDGYFDIIICEFEGGELS